MTLCKLLKLVVIDELETKCYAPPDKFDFQHGFNCPEALFAVTNSIRGSDIALG